jgi:hypothetical protein
MSKEPASAQPNAGPGKQIGIKITIAVLSIGSIATAVALIKMTAERDAAKRWQQQLQGHVRPAADDSNWTKFATIREGMTVEQVKAIMGPGERVADRDGLERLQWKQPIKDPTLTHNVSVKVGMVSNKGSELR